MLFWFLLNVYPSFFVTVSYDFLVFRQECVLEQRHQYGGRRETEVCGTQGKTIKHKSLLTYIYNVRQHDFCNIDEFAKVL